MSEYGEVLRGADHKIEKLATGLLKDFEGSVRAMRCSSRLGMLHVALFEAFAKVTLVVKLRLLHVHPYAPN